MENLSKWVTLSTFLLLVSFCSADVSAQPFGIMTPQGQPESQKQVLCSQCGRFVFGQISNNEKDQFMLDTHTGRLWRIAERGDIGKYLINVPYCNSKGECFPNPVGILEPRKDITKKP